MIILYHPHTRIRGEKLEDFEDVDLGGAIGEAGIAEDGAEGLAAGDRADHGIRNVRVEAGDQIAVVIGMHGAAVDRLARVRQRQWQAPVDQAAEQQIEIGAIFLDVGHQIDKSRLRDIRRRIIDVLHVTAIIL